MGGTRPGKSCIRFCIRLVQFAVQSKFAYASEVIERKWLVETDMRLVYGNWHFQCRTFGHSVTSPEMVTAYFTRTCVTSFLLTFAAKPSC